MPHCVKEYTFFLSPMVFQLNVMVGSYCTWNRDKRCVFRLQAFKACNSNRYSLFCDFVCVFVLDINTNVDTVSSVRFLVYPTLRRCLNVCCQAKICECVCLEHAESSTKQQCYVVQSCFGVFSGVPLVRFECTRGFVRNREGGNLSK